MKLRTLLFLLFCLIEVIIFFIYYYNIPQLFQHQTENSTPILVQDSSSLQQQPYQFTYQNTTPFEFVKEEQTRLCLVTYLNNHIRIEYALQHWLRYANPNIITVISSSPFPTLPSNITFVLYGVNGNYFEAQFKFLHCIKLFYQQAQKNTDIKFFSIVDDDAVLILGNYQLLLSSLPNATSIPYVIGQADKKTKRIYGGATIHFNRMALEMLYHTLFETKNCSNLGHNVIDMAISDCWNTILKQSAYNSVLLHSQPPYFELTPLLKQQASMFGLKSIGYSTEYAVSYHYMNSLELHQLVAHQMFEPKRLQFVKTEQEWNLLLNQITKKQEIPLPTIPTTCPTSSTFNLNLCYVIIPSTTHSSILTLDLEGKYFVVNASSSVDTSLPEWHTTLQQKYSCKWYMIVRGDAFVLQHNLKGLLQRFETPSEIAYVITGVSEYKNIDNIMNQPYTNAYLVSEKFVQQQRQQERKRVVKWYGCSGNVDSNAMHWIVTNGFFRYSPYDYLANPKIRNTIENYYLTVAQLDYAFHFEKEQHYAYFRSQLACGLDYACLKQVFVAVVESLLKNGAKKVT